MKLEPGGIEVRLGPLANAGLSEEKAQMRPLWGSGALLRA